MAKVYKKVNVIAKTPVNTVNPPIRGTVRGTKLTVEQIRACIMARAIVEEVFPDGSTVKLTLANYNKDNTPVVEEKVAEPEAVVEEPVKEEEATPVAEEAPKKETNSALQQIKEMVAARKATEATEAAKEEEPAKVEEDASDDEEADVEEESDSTLTSTDDDDLEVMDLSELGL